MVAILPPTLVSGIIEPLHHERVLRVRLHRPPNFEGFYYRKGKGSGKYAHVNDESDSEKTWRIKAIRKEGLGSLSRGPLLCAGLDWRRSNIGVPSNSWSELSVDRGHDFY